MSWSHRPVHIDNGRIGPMCRPCSVSRFAATLALALLLPIAAASVFLAGTAHIVMADEGSPALLTQVDSGKLVRLKVGQDVSVELPASLGTGYGWRVARSSTPLLRQTASSVRGNVGLPGGSNMQRLTFAAVAVGRGKLHLEYVRPWEKAAPSKTFSASIAIAR